MKFGLRESDLIYMQRLFEQEPAIEQVWLFGSRAKQTNQPGSDIDLALVGQNLTRQLVARIHATLEEDSPIPYFFDVLHWDKVHNEHVKTEIQRTALPIYKRAV